MFFRRPPTDGKEFTTLELQKPEVKLSSGKHQSEIIGTSFQIPSASEEWKATNGTASFNPGDNGPVISEPSQDSLPQETQQRVVTHITIFPSQPSVSSRESATPPGHVTETVSPVLEAPVVNETPLQPPPLLKVSQSEGEDSKADMVFVKEGSVEVTSVIESNTPTPTPSSDSGGGKGNNESSLLLAKHWGPEKLVTSNKLKSIFLNLLRNYRFNRLKYIENPTRA